MQPPPRKPPPPLCLDSKTGESIIAWHEHQENMMLCLDSKTGESIIQAASGADIASFALIPKLGRA